MLSTTNSTTSKYSRLFTVVARASQSQTTARKYEKSKQHRIGGDPRTLGEPGKKSLELMSNLIARVGDKQLKVSEVISLGVSSLRYFESNKFRTPIKDACQYMLPLLTREEAQLSEVLDVLQITGRAMLYYQELIDYCEARAERMTPEQLSIFISECGRHGLRCKHVMENVLVNKKNCIVCVSRMNQEQLFRVCKALSRFGGDFSVLVKKAINMIQVDHALFKCPENVLVLLRLLKQVDCGTKYPQVLGFIDSHMESTALAFPVVDKLVLIHLLKKSRTFAAGDVNYPEIVAKSIITKLLSSLQNTTISDLKNSGVIVTDISDAMDALASLKIVDSKILSVWMDFLVQRVTEIKYSPVTGLWQAITDSLGHLRYFNGKWMRVVEDIGSNQFSLKSFAAFQLIFFTSCLGRLNFFSEKLYSAIASVLASDVRSVNDTDMLSTLLFPFERVCVYKTAPDMAPTMDKLIEAVLDQAINISENRKADMKSVQGAIAVVYLVLSMRMSAGIGTENMSKVTQIMETVIPQIPNLNKKLYAQDARRMYRINQIMGDASKHNQLPTSIGRSRMYCWSDPEAHAIAVNRVNEELRGQLVYHIPGGDILLPDGTVVVVDDFAEVMKTWSEPGNDQSEELVPVTFSGNAELCRSLLKRQGHEKVKIVRLD